MLNTLHPQHHYCFHSHSIEHLHPSKLHRLEHLRHSNTRIRTPHFATGIFHTFSAIDKQDNKRNHQNRDHDEDYDADKDRDCVFFNRIFNSSPIYLNDTPLKNEIEEDSDGDRCESSSGISSNMWWADLKATVGQRVNMEGLLFAVSVITKHKHWVIPHVSVPDVRYIDWPALKRKGFEGVVFDKDNTLTVPYSLALWGPIVGSLESCKSVFGNNIAVFSNSAGLQEYDPDGRKARALEFVIGIRVIRHSNEPGVSLEAAFLFVRSIAVKKPAGSAEEIERHFGCDSSKLIMVGDRPFTDIVYGNRNGFLTILTAPLSLAEEPFIVKQVRKIELALVNRWSKKGLKPANERLLSDALDCVKQPPFV